MVIERKGTKKEIEDFISKGGSTPSEKKRNSKYYYKLMVPSEINERIEDALKNRPGLSKNAWIVEAIHKALPGEEK